MQVIIFTEIILLFPTLCNYSNEDTVSLVGSMRRSSPVIVLSLLVLMFALGTSTVGNSKRDNKTIFGAIQYVIGGEY